MAGRILDLIAAPALDRGAIAAVVALVLGAVSMLSPPLALLGLALLAARALLSGSAIDWRSLAGPIVAALVVGAFFDLSGLIGTLFVWRVFADARWSVAEATRLAAAAGRPAETTLKALAHAWLTPLYGLTLVAYSAPHMIAGLPLDLPHLPLWAVAVVGALAASAVIDWGLRRAADWRLGELAAAPAAHLLIHHAIFLVAFGLMIDVTAGLVIMAGWRLMHAAPARVAT